MIKGFFFWLNKLAALGQKTSQAIIISIFMSMMIGVNAQAQTPPPFVDPAEELERERELERREEEARRFQARPEEEKQEADKKPAFDPSKCIEIDHIEVSGTELFAGDHRIDQLLAPFAPKCMNRDDIAAAMKALDDAYIERGHITSKTYIKKQDFKDRILHLTVVEGRVEDIIIINDKGERQPSRREKTAFFMADNGLLQLRDFEQGIDQMNRLHSVKAQMKLKPGSAAGYTIVEVTTKEQDRHRGHIHWDNLGSSTTGEDQIRLSYAAGNLLNANDSWSLSYVGAVDSNALSFDFSLPFKYATWSLGITASDYLIPLTVQSELFGDSVSATTSLHYVLARDARTKTYAQSTLQWRRSRRFINSVLLTPQDFTTARLSLGRILDLEKAKWAMDIGVSHGLPWFNATKDAEDIDHNDPHAQFWALEAGLTRYAKPKSWGKWSASLRLKAAEDALYSVEQIPIGSRSTIRGYETPLLTADIAGYARLDMQLKIPAWWQDRENTGLQTTGIYLSKYAEPYLFLDVGAGHAYAQDLTDYAGGTGFGLKIKTKKFTASLGTEVPVSEPGPNRDFKWRTQAKLSWKLF